MWGIGRQGRQGRFGVDFARFWVIFGTSHGGGGGGGYVNFWISRMSRGWIWGGFCPFWGQIGKAFCSRVKNLPLNRPFTPTYIFLTYAYTLITRRNLLYNLLILMNSCFTFFISLLLLVYYISSIHP